MLLCMSVFTKWFIFKFPLTLKTLLGVIRAYVHFLWKLALSVDCSFLLKLLPLSLGVLSLQPTAWLKAMFQELDAEKVLPT